MHNVLPMDLPIIKSHSGSSSNNQWSSGIATNNGRSLPLFEKITKSQYYLSSYANHDNNQHAENENIRIQNLFDRETMGSLMLLK
jgi:hypothetical protein